ncbi:MAG: VTT domain-containing protein [Cypionkella sp.]|nr:VTT domain-containing protein [Cypionkella sp.]
MTDWLLSLVPVWGLWLVAGATFASCLALPIPASLIMLAAGGFAAAGDLVLWQVAGAAVTGAVLGDQAGFWAGRRGGAPLLDRLSAQRGRGKVIARARGLMAVRGGVAVFLSRWLFSPLGPYVNVIAGAMREDWRRFTLWGVAGEVVWCGLYVLMGRAFAGNLAAATDLIGSALGLIAAGTVALGLGLWLWRQARRDGAALSHRRK